MISIKTYKEILKKEDDKVYNLGGNKLIQTQIHLVNLLEKMFINWYKIALEEIKNNTELKLMWQSIEIQKIANETDSENIIPELETAFILGMEQLTLAFQKDPNIDISFNIKNEDALEYAKYQAGKLIGQVDEYTKTRIANLIKQALEKGWGYDKIVPTLKADYSFSNYRAKLIASHELGNAYLYGKEVQFDKYRKEYSEIGYKNWVSHRDNVTTPGCLHNDLQGRIEKDKDFESDGKKSGPTRFPGCRCNVVYRLYKPNDERLTSENATEIDIIQANIKIDTFE